MFNWFKNLFNGFADGGVVSEEYKKLDAQVTKEPYLLSTNIINGDKVFVIYKKSVWDGMSGWVIVHDKIGHAKTKKQALSHIKHFEKANIEVKRKELK